MDLLPRVDMALSLGFHIVFASVGMTMPLLMVLAEHRWRRTGAPEALLLAKAWAKGTAVLFAVGAVSGTVLSFELGLLFPKFMETAGPVLGLPFALEGVAFFTEAVFLGLYLYGWNLLKPSVHLFAGWVVVGSGLLSAVFVTIANSWMQTPAGFAQIGDKLVLTSLTQALWPPSASHEIPHGVLASYAAVATMVAAIHAARLLKERASKFHLLALKLSLAVALPTNLLQPLLGHNAGQDVARLQPVKLAALEGHFETKERAPLLLGGIVDYERGESRGALALPGVLSFLATGNFDSTVSGLKDFDRSLWPPPLTRYAFQVMILCGTLLMLGYLWIGFRWWRHGLGDRELKLIRAMGPLGIIALEAGWVAAEVGRQPWILSGLMKTSEAVAVRPDLWISLLLFMALYGILGWVVAKILIDYARSGAKVAVKDEVVLG